MRDWTHSQYGTAETMRIDKFRLTVHEPMHPKEEPARYEAQITLDVRGHKPCATREEAQALALRILRQVIAHAQQELDALEGEAEDA